ncbi:MAG TPA: magnesium transporter CorA family protein, partial [Isosphaeraceae bacterium]|nr:magnesium transporter CorA family protein [Isosphaeraceae bacterium]
AVDKVRKLLERDPENKLKRRPDHILYLLIDQGVSEHLAAIEHLDEAIDDAQNEVFDHPTHATLQRIFQVKRSVACMHRVIAPQREVANRLARDMYSQIGARDRVYFRDCYDSLVRLHDITESVRDLVSGALETYLSVTSNRTNDIMKALTIATVLFLPLNFVVGFFGMNFFSDNIALEGNSTHTLLFLLASLLMIGSAGGIWYWGRSRGWY